MAANSNAATATSSFYACPWPDCGKIYSSKESLRKHQRNKNHRRNNTKGKKLLCPVTDCGKW